MRHLAGIALVALAAVAAASCGGADTTGPTSNPTPTLPRPLTIVSGGNVSDTVQVTLTAPLVVAVRALDGTPRAGVVVRLDAVGSADTSRRTERLISVAPVGAGPFGASDTETTDAQGRVSARIQFGTISGAARVAITTNDGMTDTARFTVGAGAAVRMDIAIHDTTVYFNETFPLGVTLRDRLGNARGDLPTMTVTPLIGAPSTVSSDGMLHAPSTMGRSRIMAQALGRTDSVFVNVVPAATIAAAQGTGSLGILVAGLNGRRGRQFTAIIAQQFSLAVSPSWSPDGSHVLVTTAPINQNSTVQLLDTLGNTVRLSIASGYTTYSSARYSRDGQWIYFAEGPYGLEAPTKVYRMHTDGSGKEVLFISTDADGGWRDPSPSAGGEFLIVNGRDVASDFTAVPRVARLDVATQRITRFPTIASSAVYSPAADRVAMVDANGQILLAATNGTGVQTLTNSVISATSFGPLTGPAWSPDGAYLVAHSAAAGRLVVVRVSDGMTVPTALSNAFGGVAWR